MWSGFTLEKTAYNIRDGAFVKLPRKISTYFG